MCTLFQENIDKVNAPFKLAAARNPTTFKGYDGVPFKFCPWCGTALSQRDSKEFLCLPNNDGSTNSGGEKQ